jgi:hypothetical protein
MITHISEKETQLVSMLRKTGDALDACTAERDVLRTLVVNVHHAKGRYHSQLAMCALYEACGLPNVKPVSGEKK